MKQNGFATFEIIIALSIIAILAAIIMPMLFQSIGKARDVEANADIKNMIVVIAQFEEDTALLPRSDGSSSRNQSLDIMFFGSLANLPEDNVWNEWRIPDIRQEANAERRNLFSNHLFHNDPNVNGFYGDKNDYRELRPEDKNGLPLNRVKRWRGPYFDSPSEPSDPWGRAYMISFFEEDGRIKGKIVSAGPNGILETEPFTTKTDPIYGSDDIVKYFQKF